MQQSSLLLLFQKHQDGVSWAYFKHFSFCWSEVDGKQWRFLYSCCC